MRARNIPAPAPCVTYRPTADGSMAIASVETREPIKMVSDWQADSCTYRFNVTCLQETGELYHIGKARTRAHAETLIEQHQLAHPEHHNARVSSL